MATTTIIPIHAGKGSSIATTLGRSTNYVKNPDKTEDGEFISTYECDALSVDAEFQHSKRRYAVLTGRDQGEHDVLAYHLRQSFTPGEIDPQTANEIGYELAMALTKGKHAFIVCTHTDKEHIHNHVIINSTSLDCRKKFHNFIGSAFALRRLSDKLCLEHGLSIVENPQPSRGSYASWMEGQGEKKPATLRDTLRTLIDAAIAISKEFLDFLAALRQENVAVKQGKHLAFKAPGQQRFIRCNSLGDAYSEAAIRERIAHVREFPAPHNAIFQEAPPSLLIDMQSAIQQAKGGGFRRWGNNFNTKEMARTLIFLQERGLDDVAKLKAACDVYSKLNGELSSRLRQIEQRQNEITELQRQIGIYRKTREVYVQYQQSGRSPRFLETHRADILLHQAAKKYFDSLHLKKLPTMDALRQEYAILTAEHKKLTPQYRQAKAEMTELLRAKYNVECILGVPEREREVTRQRALGRSPSEER